MEVNPKYYSAFQARGRAFLKEGKPDHALADYFRAIELGKKDELWWVELAARDFSARKDQDRAIAILSRALENDPMNARWVVARGKEYSKQSRYDQELSDYFRAIELSKKDGLWWVEEAARELSARKDIDRAITILSRAMEVDPLNARWVLLRAEQYSKQSHNEQKITDYLRALEIDAPKAVLLIISAANKSMEQKQYGSAISLLTRAIEVRPDDTELHLARVKMYQANGQSKDAERDLNIAIELCTTAVRAKPSETDGYFERATAYALKGSWEATLADAKHGLSLVTGSDQLASKGIDADAISVAHDAKQFQLAVSWYEELADQIRKAETAEKGKPGVNTAQALATLSYQLLFVKRFKEALAAADEAVGLSAETNWFSINRAHALLFSGRVEEARALYATLWEKRPSEYSEPWGQSILEDFKDFEKSGLAHPQIAEIKGLHPAP